MPRAVAYEEKPTLKILQPTAPMKLYGIQLGTGWLIAWSEAFVQWGERDAAAPFGWTSAHRFLAHRPALEGAQVVAF